MIFTWGNAQRIIGILVRKLAGLQVVGDNCGLIISPYDSTTDEDRDFRPAPARASGLHWCGWSVAGAAGCREWCVARRHRGERNRLPYFLYLRLFRASFLLRLSGEISCFIGCAVAVFAVPADIQYQFSVLSRGHDFYAKSVSSGRKMNR